MIDELRLPIKSVGMTNIPALMSFLPVGLRALTHHKLPPMFHKPIENVRHLRRLIRKLEDPEQE